MDRVFLNKKLAVISQKKKKNSDLNKEYDIKVKKWQTDRLLHTISAHFNTVSLSLKIRKYGKNVDKLTHSQCWRTRRFLIHFHTTAELLNSEQNYEIHLSRQIYDLYEFNTVLLGLWLTYQGRYEIIDTRQGRPCTRLRDYLVQIFYFRFLVLSSVIFWSTESRMQDNNKMKNEHICDVFF